MRIDVFVYIPACSGEIIEIFKKMYHQVLIKRYHDDLFKLEMDSSLDDELMDFEMIHASIIGDFSVDATFVVLDSMTYDYLGEEYIVSFINLLQHKVYKEADLLIEFSKYKQMKQMIKRNLVDFLGQDYVNTILMIAKSNMNLSISAKKLFLHRNSLNYRIDKIESMTGIDIKTFKGLRALVSILES